MGWKDLPYWLKGGAIFALAYIFISLFLVPFGKKGDLFGFYYWAYPSLVVMAPLSTIIPLERILNIGNEVVSLILVLLVSLMIYFIIGALIGLIVGKIKNKNNLQ